MSDHLVLVTGASGYVGSHVVKRLQEEGHRVRGTVRSLSNEKKISFLYNMCPDAKHKLELVEADLLKPESWLEAVKGCTYVHHVASPFPLINPKTEEELIGPAVQGTLSVLKACAETKTVKRVVLTSSIVAVVPPFAGRETPCTEAEWVDPEMQGLNVYTKSKTLAEKAAWNFVQELPEGEKFELAVINPCLIMGPPLNTMDCSSVSLMKRLMNKEMPMVPKFNLNMVDVRDVALAHVKSMTLPEAVGHRHILSSGNMWMKDIGVLLKKEFESQGYSIPTKEIPSFLMAFLSWFDKEIGAHRKLEGKVVVCDTTRMKDALGINPHKLEDSLIDMAYAMVDLGCCKKTTGYKSRQTSQ